LIEEKPVEHPEENNGWMKDDQVSGDESKNDDESK